MNINNIFRYTLLGLCAAPLAANAQVKLADKETQKVTLGFEVESTEALTTAATTTITAEELQRTSAISLADALYGKLLGLTATQNTGFKGEEGKGASFNIRGVQTRSGNTANFADANDILILVDGVERPIDRILVEEVESVTVLKDAAAVALFGHEGINGVLYVKTKRGVAGSGNHVKAGYSHKFAFDPQMADMVGAYDYARALNMARVNDGLAPAYTDAELAKFQDGSDPYVYPNVDWKSQAFRNTAHESQAFVSMYGGTDKVQYYTQLNYTDARGIYKNTKQNDYNSQLKYSKANIRANVDFKVSETTKVSASMLAMFMETNGLNGVSSNDAWWHLYKVPALAYPVQTADGVWGGSQTFGDYNIVAKMRGTGFQKTHQRQIWANATLDQDLSMLVKGLKFYIGASYDNSSNIYEQKSKGYQYGWNYYDASNNLAEEVQGTIESKLNFNYWVEQQWRLGSLNTGFKYNTQFGNGDNLALNASYNIKGELRDGQHHSWYRTNWQLATHYDHANKFMADLVLAANGSNRSYPAKWAFSPTLGLGYIYANNGDDAVLSFGKVRASGGMQHTDYTPEAGMWLAPWNMSHGQFVYGSSFQSSWGAFLQAFPTTDFQQETAYKANLGTDIRLIGSLDFTFDAFYQKRANILVPATQKNSTVVGLQSAYDDKGEVSSYGFEAGLRYAKTFDNGLNLYGGSMFTYTKSRVDAWIENPAYDNLSIIGSAADAARGLVALGFFADEADIAASPRQEFGQVKPGDIKYKDINGDGVINQNDEVAFDFGTSCPAFNYALNLGVEYKGIGLNATLQGAGQQLKNLRYVDGAWGALSGNRNLSSEYFSNCWDNAGTVAALYPRLSTESVANNEQASSIWYRNAKWLKMRDVELYYRLPQSRLTRAKIGDAKIFVQGQNLLSWSNIKTMDAENLSTGYPVMKSVNVGLNVTF